MLDHETAPDPGFQDGRPAPAAKRYWTSFCVAALSAIGLAFWAAVQISDRVASPPALRSLHDWAARALVLAVAVELLIGSRLLWLSLSSRPTPRWEPSKTRRRVGWALGIALFSNWWMLFAGSQSSLFWAEVLHERWLAAVMFGAMSVAQTVFLLETGTVLHQPIPRATGRWALAISILFAILIGLVIWFDLLDIVSRAFAPLLLGFGLLKGGLSVLSWTRKEFARCSLPPGLSSHRGLRRSVVACGAIERLLPPRLAREELGDALERAVALARAGAPSWRLDALWVTAIATALGNALREAPRALFRLRPRG